MNAATLRGMLRTHLRTVPDLPVVQWEQVVFTQPPEDTWLEDEVRPGTTTVLGNGTVITRGLYLLTLHTPPDRVLADLDAMADRIGHVFEPGRTLVDPLRSHLIELTGYDGGAVRRVNAWGYRRMSVAFTATAFRTTLLPT